MRISAREVARLGHLFLNRGKWKGKQLISASWVAAASAVQVPAKVPMADTKLSPQDGRGVYGFNWWVNGVRPGGKRKWPGAPAGTYAGIGHNNNYMFVIPELKMVVVRLGLDSGGGGISDAVWGAFLAKVSRASAAKRQEKRPGTASPAGLTFGLFGAEP
ncbi:unnamed protein product [marine sediment metagenome]|uniref:Beta-lactamase-related domain-containing protein n=1 Tax=marine sediment metagenome TaxID=412755 RepID=X0ZDB2_9ZZZZ